MFMHIYTCMCMFMYAGKYIMYMHVFIQVRAYMFVCMYIYISVYACVYMCVCLCLCLCIHMCVCARLYL